MRVGIHLPQFGRAAVVGGTQQAATLAERLGYDDVWVSDHLVVPKDQPYPTPYLYDPLMCLAFAAAVTSRVGLGTSVLVGPQYTSPLALANSLATLDNMSGGRLTLGIGIGWSKLEYEALHAPFDHRGGRLNEMLDLFRTVWRDDPATHQGTYYAFSDIRILPKPQHDIPIWLGGATEAALARAVVQGDGFHGINIKPDNAKEWVDGIRARRPDPEFTISLRIPWDTKAVAAEELAENCSAYEAAGVQHVVISADRGDLAAWLGSMESVASALGLSAAA
jgi:probable F420-dependent oxidoreductase